MLRLIHTLLLVAVCAACARETPNAPSSPPSTLAPSPTPGPSSSPSPSGPTPAVTPATCPCAWQFGISRDPEWVYEGQTVPNGVPGGWGFAFSTQHFTRNGSACDAGHPNCGGRECNDPRGPLFSIVGPPGYNCDDTGGKHCPRSDPWTLKIGSNKQPLVAGTYIGTARLRNHLIDGEGEPVEICPDAPRSTTRTWVVE